MAEPTNKIVCPHCGQIHDQDLDSITDVSEMLASTFTEAAFPEVWKDAKQDLKELTKRELAEEMFYTGAVQMLTAFLSTMHEQAKEEEKQK